MSAPTTLAPRRVPPPCWTQDETLALINAYGARWMSLNRGNLRASDWDSVSSAVSDSGLGAPKSALQCRHKIEKLRQRYRSEKQRSLGLPGRFVSSWDLFPLLDSIDFGSSSSMGPNHVSNQKIMNVNKLQAELVNGKSRPSKSRKIDDDVSVDVSSNPKFRSDLLRNCSRSDSIDDFGGGYFGSKSRDESNFVDFRTRANGFLKVDGDSIYKFAFNHDLRGGFGVKMQSDVDFMSPEIKLKSYKESNVKKSSSIQYFNYNFDGCQMATLVDDIFAPPPGFKQKNHQKNYGNCNRKPFCYAEADYGDVNENEGGSIAKTLHDKGFVPLGNYNGDPSTRLKLGKKNGLRGVKRGLDQAGELVSSITQLMEKFVKVERMKMEMVKETEKVRMEMEMKHNQMMLELQQQVLESSVKGLLGKKKRKHKVKVKVKVKEEVVSPKATRSGDDSE